MTNTLKQKKVPLRKCSGCGEMKPKRDLIRVVRAPDKTDDDGQIVSKGDISLDLTGKKSGRGAYICKDLDCLKLARKARRLERSLSCRIPDEVYDKLEKELGSNGQ